MIVWMIVHAHIRVSSRTYIRACHVSRQVVAQSSIAPYAGNRSRISPRISIGCGRVAQSPIAPRPLKRE